MKVLTNKQKREITRQVEDWARKNNVLDPHEKLVIFVSVVEMRQIEFSFNPVCPQGVELYNLLECSVNTLEFSVRVANNLNNRNICTLRDLVQSPRRDFLKYRNFGKKSLREVEEKLAALGLSLGMDISSAVKPTESLGGALPAVTMG